ncbi:hypothetical protein GCM10011321_03050 [Youhaiella tibetensis]|uniref:VanZ family protein n=1 Tax=Paradevosia tibetensis TaxID=1447062 RepID=UPI000AAA3B80|nr:hypothetical protein GCM10011321_03050 [Youhaiella tibetensis]
MIRALARPLAWLLLLALLYVTVSPIEWRPMTGEPANIERFAAFALVGFVFVLGYPRHWWLVLAIMVGSAFLFELAQLIAPGRHAHLKDALIKAGGGSVGIAAGVVANFIVGRFAAYILWTRRNRRTLS